MPAVGRFTRIDDLGLRPPKGDEPIELCEIIRLRYERGATVTTASRDTDELHQLYGDPLLACAWRTRSPDPFGRAMLGWGGP